MKKYLSLFLALVLALSCFSAVSAEDAAPSVHAKTSKVFDGDLGENGNIVPSVNGPQNPVWDKANGTFKWNGYAGSVPERSKFTFNTPLKAYIGRSYKFTLDISGSDADESKTWWDSLENQMVFSSTGEGDYLVLESKSNGAKTGQYTQIQWGGTVFAERKEIVSDDSLVTYIPSSRNGGLYDELKFINFWNTKSSQADLVYTVYGIDVEETVTYCDELFNIGANGSVRINSYADLDGKNAVSNKPVSDGERVEFEMNTQPVFSVAADAGYLIDTVTYNGAEIADASGKNSYTFTADRVSDAGTFAVTFKEGGETAVNYDRISLSANTTLYKNTAREASPIIVTAYDSEGVETDITGSNFLRYTTSNPLAFALDGNLLSTGSVNGMSIVTATYKRADNTEIKASVIFQNTKQIADMLDGSNADFKYDEPGHAKGSSSCIAWHAKSSITDVGAWQMRVYTGGNASSGNGGYNWADGKYRLVSGWFYDDGEHSNFFRLFLRNLRQDARDRNKPFTYYAEIGKKAGSNVYAPNNLASVNSTKGWHQTVVFVDNSGYVNMYIDGVLVNKLAMPIAADSDLKQWYSEDYASYLEFRTDRPDNTGTYKFDELYIADYPTVKPEYTAALTMADGERLSVNGVSAENGSEIKINAGSSVKFESPVSYKLISTIKRVDAIGLNSETYTVNAKEYTIENINDDARYEVEFSNSDVAVTLEKTGNGKVLYTKSDNESVEMNDGSNNVEGGERTFKFVSDEGYMIDSVKFGGKEIPVTDDDSFEAVLSVTEPTVLEVSFKQKEIKGPSLSTGEPAWASDYDYSSVVPGAAPSNTIVGYAKIDFGYGSVTIIECGYYVTNENGKKLTLPAIAVPEGKVYGIRMVGIGVVPGTYTLQPYIELSDGNAIIGEEKTVTVK